MKWNKGESTLASRGYSNWKDAVTAFKKHEGSECHNSFIKVVSNLRYLARQGIALKGDEDESNLNFMQLLRLLKTRTPGLKTG